MLTFILCILCLVAGFVFGIATILSYQDSHAPIDPLWQQHRGRLK